MSTPRPSASSAESLTRPPRVVAWLAGALVAGVVLWLASRVLLLCFAAVLVAIFLRALVNWVSGKVPLSQAWSLAIVVLSLTLLFAGLVWLLAPRVAQQVDQLSNALPRSVDKYAQALQQYEWGSWLLERAQSANDIIRPEGVLSSGFGALLGGLFSSTVGAFINVALVIIIGLYLSAEAPSYAAGLLALVPPQKRDRASEVLGLAIRSLQGWLLGKIASMAILGVVTFIGLTLLEVPLALTLAVLTALLTFIPNLGAILSVVPPFLLALADSPLKALYVLLLYVVLQNVEGMFITPMIQRRAAALPPALLIGAQLVLAALFGFFGLLLAAPLCALGIVLVKTLYLEDVLGQPVSIGDYSGRSGN